jgi:twitching motility protein PilJ
MLGFGKKKTAPVTHSVPLAGKEDAPEKGGWLKVGKKPKLKRASVWSSTSKNGGEGASVPHEVSAPDSHSHTPSTDAWQTKTVKSLPVIGKWALRQQYLFGAAVAIAGLIAASGLYFYVEQSQEMATTKRAEARGVRTTSESMSKNLQKVVNGKTNVFEIVTSSRDSIEKSLSVLASNTRDAQSLAALKTVQNDWKVLSKNVDSVTSNKAVFEQFAENQEALSDAQPLVDRAAKRFIELATKKETDERTRQRMVQALIHLNQIEQNATRMASMDETFREGPFLIAKNLTQFKRYLDDLENGNAATAIQRLSDEKARVRLTQLKETFNASFAQPVTALSSSALLIQTLKGSSNAVSNKSDEFLNHLNALVTTYDNERLQAQGLLPFAGIGLAFFLLGLGLMVLIYTREERRMEIESRATLSRNQQAVMQLLNEIAPVREGDLTRKVTVMDEFTATIADAINATVEDLSGLVRGVQSSSEEMASAAERMGSYSKMALGLSERQVTSVTSAADAVTRVEGKLQILAQRAEETTQLASRSLSITNEGSRTVSESLNGMRAIQSKVSDTRDRVLRLKDTSGQIAEILGAIRDIAEKTNVLAINANLEAKRAGAAGKGFTVVAQSVQGLAQQATDATRRIGALIDSVQSDIEGATKSMNDTASEMESAAKRSEITGEAFIEIEEASNQLSEAIEAIREQVLEQAKESIQIQRQMNEVVDTVNEANKMNETANGAAKEVEASMVKLNQSTERFKVI